MKQGCDINDAVMKRQRNDASGQNNPDVVAICYDGGEEDFSNPMINCHSSQHYIIFKNVPAVMLPLIIP
jgi:hypothetical protein